MQRQYQPDDLMKKLMSTAWELFVEVDDSEKFLLHGDLHHENILQAGNGEWKIIDPQGVVGSAVFECGRFIENHVINDNGIDREEAFHAISYVADRMSQPERRVAAAFLILHLLSVSWGYEMNYTREQLAHGVLECAELVKMIETFPDCIQPHR
jgi:streptomycin 6-kinase